jgi:hypothetical protein
MNDKWSIIDYYNDKALVYHRPNEMDREVIIEPEDVASLILYLQTCGVSWGSRSSLDDPPARDEDPKARAFWKGEQWKDSRSA